MPEEEYFVGSQLQEYPLLHLEQYQCVVEMCLSLSENEQKYICVGVEKETSVGLAENGICVA